MNRVRRGVAIWASLIALTLIASGCSTDNNSTNGGQNTPKIGLVQTLSGAYADFGKLFQNGAALAVDDLKAGEGPVDKPTSIKLEWADSQSDPQASAQALTKLATVDDVSLAIVGGSGPVLGMAPVATQHELPIINASATTPQMRGASPFLSSIVVEAETEVAQLVEFAVKEIGIKKFAAIGPEDEQGLGAIKAAEAAAADLGAEIVEKQTHQLDSTDMRSQLLRMKNSGAEGALLFSCGKPGGYVLRQAEEIGYEPKAWFTYSVCISPDLFEVGGKATEDLYATRLALDPKESEATRAYIEEYKKKFGSAAEIYGALIYDAIMIGVEAIQAVGDDDGAALNKYILSHTFHGVTGKISFDKDGMAVREMGIYQVKAGELQRVQE